MTEKPTENIITEADRELLAQAYEETGYGGGSFLTYAELARREYGAFTLCSLRAIARARADERKKVAAFVADFSWTLPVYGDPTDENDRQKWAGINEASDDAACSVCEQISAAILKLPESLQ